MIEVKDMAMANNWERDESSPIDAGVGGLVVRSGKRTRKRIVRMVGSVIKKRMLKRRGCGVKKISANVGLDP